MSSPATLAPLAMVLLPLLNTFIKYVMLPQILRIATRKSPLALWQANHVANLLIKQWPELKIELLPMSTSGDKFLKQPLLAAGGKGLFVKELEEALLDKRADIAVHSMKDVPSTFPPGLHLASICKRDNPFDALITPQYANIDQLPQGAVVGTTSLRRQSQLLAHRPDLIMRTLRGNIHTRMEKLDAGEFDAIVLAASGLSRMNLEYKITEIFHEEFMLPACGQGALGIESRIEDDAIAALLAPLNDSTTATCVHIERHVNHLLGGNCHVPVAIYCQSTTPSTVLLKARVMSADGRMIVKDVREGSILDSTLLAQHCAQHLLNQGAATLLNTL